MKIGILITSIGNFGQRDFYNAQEIGLAKALDGLCDKVMVYKLVESSQAQKNEKVQGFKNVTVMYIPSKNYGINGIIDTNILETELDALIYFSDTQFCVTKVYKWAKKNDIMFFPYIGVIESHSTSILKKRIVDWMFKRNLKVYRQCRCFVKTPTVKESLERIGVKNITITPVGLDLSLLKSDYENYDPIELKAQYGYRGENKVLLFIGRLIEEKQPMRMIEIFSEVYKKDSAYRLLIVGSGELKDQVVNSIKEKCLEDQVKMIDKIPNKDIWELYRFADCFVNLNQQEIFGMAILEAMFYGCKVVAWKAPGPSFIIEDGVSGYLVSSNIDTVERLFLSDNMTEVAHDMIVRRFTWIPIAEHILKSMIGDNK